MHAHVCVCVCVCVLCVCVVCVCTGVVTIVRMSVLAPIQNEVFYFHGNHCIHK